MKRVLALALLAACVPDLGDRDSLVTEPAILAVRVEPPESKPGGLVRYDLLVATPDGPIATPAARWAYCSSAKLLTENGAVSAACLRDVGAKPIADGPSIEAAIPDDACRVFGPNVVQQDLRPRDPDVTGGYYQPVRAIAAGKVGFGFARVDCGLAGAALDVAADFRARYTANKNPILEPISATPSLDAVPRGARVTLRASWPADAAEPYVVYDLATRAVIAHRESMRVSWFATSGAFDVDRTGRSEEERELFTENGWTAPATARTVHLFVVLRDARGGSVFTTLTATVR